MAGGVTAAGVAGVLAIGVVEFLAVKKAMEASGAAEWLAGNRGNNAGNVESDEAIRRAQLEEGKRKREARLIKQQKPVEPLEKPYIPESSSKSAEAKETNRADDFKKLSDRFAELADEMKTLNEFLLLNNPAGNPHYA